MAYENNGLYTKAEQTYLKALEQDATNSRIRDNYERFRIFYSDYIQHRDREEAAKEPRAATAPGSP